LYPRSISLGRVRPLVSPARSTNREGEGVHTKAFWPQLLTVVGSIPPFQRASTS